MKTSQKLVIALAVIAAVVAVWQAALGDWGRVGCWVMIVLYLQKNYETEETYERHLHHHPAPAVDAEPVRHGYWIYGDAENGEPDAKCSACGNELNFEASVSQEEMKYLGMNYCNFCGAKMDGGADDEKH